MVASNDCTNRVTIRVLKKMLELIVKSEKLSCRISIESTLVVH